MKWKSFLPYFLILPALAYLVFFIAYPLTQSFILIFKESDIQVLKVLTDHNFLMALKYTLALAVAIIPIQVALALILAVIMNKAFKGRDLALYALIIPLIISDVAGGLIWYSILAPYGFLNKVLINIGILDSPIYFFGYQFRNMEFLAIVLAELWRLTAPVFVMILAGLQMISKDYIEAAEVFGATYWIKLRQIIFPLLKPTLQTVLLIRTIWSMQIFGIVWVLAGRDIPVLTGEAYYQMTELKNYGVASIYVLVIATLSILLGALYLKFLKAEYLEVKT